jgi:phosphate transport system permease protein
MTDMTQSGTSLLVQDSHTKKRNRAEARFKIYGLAAIAMAC